MIKKNNAIMIADTRPSLIGNILIQLNETNKGLFDEAVIYYDEISKKDMKIMQEIMPCRFIHFDYEFSNDLKSLSAFKKFSSLMFSRYYMFDLLNDYETITWIDTDVLICGKLDSIIKKAKRNGMAANFEDKKNKSYKYVDYVMTSFKTPVNNYDMNKYNMSSGLIVVSDSLKNFDEMRKWCFDKTVEYASYLQLPDQGILNLLIQEFDINVASFGEKGAYCFYPSYKRNSKDAKIIHAWGTRKFWKSWYLFNEYPKWNYYQKKWLSLGGSSFIDEINPEVSVVIPMFKPNIDFFKLVLDDLLVNQVQEHGFQYDDFEVILVIDGDENESLIKLIKKYNDPRIKLIFNDKREGIAKSLNIGIKASKGKYIARVDDDDRINPNRLYKQAQYLKNNDNIHLVTSNFEYFGNMNEGRVSFEKEMSHAWSIFTCPFDHPTIMFKKDFFVDNDLFYDERRKYVEDWELWIRAFNKGLVVGTIPEILYYHRWRDGQAGQNQNTINMMRELVKNNFKKLNINLTKEDLIIISPFNGIVHEPKYSRIVHIFDEALKNNIKLKEYDQESLKKAFDYRLFEAKEGYIKDIIIKKEIVSNNTIFKRKESIKQKLLHPVYKPIKRVFYNIITESIIDNLFEANKKMLSQNSFLSNEMNETNNLLTSSKETLLNEINETNKLLTSSKEIIFNKLSETNKSLVTLNNKTTLISDKLYDQNKKTDLFSSVDLNSLYLESKIVLIGTSEHSNIGDAAITMGAFEFIRKYFNHRKLIEVSTYEFEDNFHYIMNIINSDDIILLQGGGNLGNKFLTEENVRRKTIEAFPNNKIIILPQTIYYEDNKNGNRELEISKRIYNEHQNLTIFTRGKTSLEFANNNFINSKNYLSYDSALNVNINYHFERKGILCCIRDLNDESGVNKSQQDEIFEIVKNNDKQFDFTNNLYKDNIFKMNRNKVVYEQLKIFAKHKLVVTDRLHGLIFSLMTNTPCIVLSSYNYKLKEYVEMLKENKYVIFIDKNIDVLDKEIKLAQSLDISVYSNDFSQYFQKVADIIKTGKSHD